MNTELRTRIAKLLSDTAGELDKEDEEKIINYAYNRLASSTKKINEEMIIDAVLAAFRNDEEEFYLEENPYEDDLFDLLRVSSYDEEIIKGALNDFGKEASVSEYDYHRGAEGAYYSPKGKDYRKPDQKDKNQMEEFEIIDEGHKDIKYHNEATKTKKVHRTKADMLTR